MSYNDSNVTLDFNDTYFANNTFTFFPTNLPTFLPTITKLTTDGCIIYSRFNQHEWIWFAILVGPCLLFTLLMVFVAKNSSENRRSWGDNGLTVIFTTFMLTSIGSIIASTVYLSDSDKYDLCKPKFVTKEIGELSWLSDISPFVNSDKDQLTEWWIACILCIILYFAFWTIKYIFEDILLGVLTECLDDDHCFKFKLLCFGQVDLCKLGVKIIFAIVMTVLSYSIVSIFQSYYLLGYDGLDNDEKCLCIDRYTNELTSTLFTMIVSPFVAILMYFISTKCYEIDCDPDNEGNSGLLQFIQKCIVFIAAGYGLFMVFLFIISPLYMIILKIASIVEDVENFNDDFEKYFSLEYGIIFVIIGQCIISSIISCCCSAAQSMADNNGTTKTAFGARSTSEAMATEINIA